jgi:adenine-specific DNA-methyltransferase
MTAQSHRTLPEHFVNALVQGDCLDLLRQLPNASVDLILTDPPYLQRYCDRTGRRLQNDDRPDWMRPVFTEVFRVLRPGRFLVCFYGWPKAHLFLDAWRHAGFRPVGHFVAPKTYASGRRLVQYRHEQAYLLAKGHVEAPASPISDVLPWHYTGNRWHPTEKPLCTLEPLIEAFSARGDLVLDPFAGSGSSLVAAARHGRRYCGFELDARYAELAQRRLRTLSHPAAYSLAGRGIVSTATVSSS